MVDYSKWKSIEISDDEDDTHPNVDTPSLFRLRHRARVERMEAQKKTKEELQMKRNKTERQLKELYEEVKQCDDNDLKDRVKQLEEERNQLEMRAQELEEKERKAPWNVDTISKESWSKTVINKPVPKVDRSQLSDEELAQLYREFVDRNEEKVRHFALLAKPEDCKQYLLSNSELVCDETSNYLALWCMELEMEGKHELMAFVAKQVVSLQFIFELAKELDIDPRACVSAFFTRLANTDREYNKAFDEELSAFKDRVRERAQIRIQKILEEERLARLGPGGLDPEEVFDSLPESLQKCFELRDIPLLHKTIEEMDEKEAEYHMKRCVDSGLWVENVNAGQKDGLMETECLEGKEGLEGKENLEAKEGLDPFGDQNDSEPKESDEKIE